MFAFGIFLIWWCHIFRVSFCHLNRCHFILSWRIMKRQIKFSIVCHSSIPISGPCKHYLMYQTRAVTTDVSQFWKVMASSRRIQLIVPSLTRHNVYNTFFMSALIGSYRSLILETVEIKQSLDNGCQVKLIWLMGFRDGLSPYQCLECHMMNWCDTGTIFVACNKIVGVSL